MTKLVDIAKSIKMSPKMARRKLRDAKWHRPTAGWVFTPAKRAAVVKLLKA